MTPAALASDRRLLDKGPDFAQVRWHGHFSEPAFWRTPLKRRRRSSAHARAPQDGGTRDQPRGPAAGARSRHRRRPAPRMMDGAEMPDDLKKIQQPEEEGVVCSMLVSTMPARRGAAREGPRRRQKNSRKPTRRRGDRGRPSRIGSGRTSSGWDSRCGGRTRRN
jgi:hypothetical protein